MPTIGIALISILMWSLVSNYRSQGALRWWHSRQLAKMHQEGEAIRNGVLQTTFFMRRHLESVPSSTETKHKLDRHYLESIERFHNSLRELSDYLYPAYIDESLPLAIEHLLNTWKNRFGLNLEYELPTEWGDEACERIHLVLMLLEEFLRIFVLEVTSYTTICVKLKQEQTLSKLTIQVTYFGDVYPKESNLTDVKASKNVFHLFRTIEILLFAKCNHHRRHQTETWYLRW